MVKPSEPEQAVADLTERVGMGKLVSTHSSGRCRYHGGFDLTGAPEGNRNAVLHNLYSRRLMPCGPHCPVWKSCPLTFSLGKGPPGRYGEKKPIGTTLTAEPVGAGFQPAQSDSADADRANNREGEAPGEPNAHDRPHGSAGASPSHRTAGPDLEICDEEEDEWIDDEYEQHESIATTTREQNEDQTEARNDTVAGVPPASAQSDARGP